MRNTFRYDFTYTDKFLLAFPVAPEYRPRVHQEIFDLSYFSEGAFTFSSVYDMPITLRKFYLNKLSEQKKKESDEIEKAKRKR